MHGQGGVGTPTIAAASAVALAQAGCEVHLTRPSRQRTCTETLPDLGSGGSASTCCGRPAAAAAGKAYGLDEAGPAVLAEDLLSPCTEEIAVFEQFSAASESRRRFVVVDTAPTGHTLLLLDATGSYHREVARPWETRWTSRSPSAPAGPSPTKAIRVPSPRRHRSWSPGPAGGPGARRYPSLGVGHQQLHHRRPRRGAFPPARLPAAGDPAGSGQADSIAGAPSSPPNPPGRHAAPHRQSHRQPARVRRTPGRWKARARHREQAGVLQRGGAAAAPQCQPRGPRTRACAGIEHDDRHAAPPAQSRGHGRGQAGRSAGRCQARCEALDAVTELG